MKTSITKILDISHTEIMPTLIGKLEDCAAFTDNKDEQDLYNSFDLLEGEDFEDVFDMWEREQLRLIEEECVKQECDYFRITY